jgi:phenylacetic acid degradation operon negative regulatory protein
VAALPVPRSRLPARLLPENWSGAKAADLFHARHADWHPAAQRHWERLTGDP